MKIILSTHDLDLVSCAFINVLLIAKWNLCKVSNMKVFSHYQYRLQLKQSKTNMFQLVSKNLQNKRKIYSQFIDGRRHLEDRITYSTVPDAIWHICFVIALSPEVISSFFLLTKVKFPNKLKCSERWILNIMKTKRKL